MGDDERVANGSVGGRKVDLEREADRLLGANGGLGYKSGFYSLLQLGRKVRDEERHFPRVDELSVPEEVVCYLAQRQLDELIDVSNLSIREEIIFRLYAAGLGCRDTGATLRLAHQTVLNGLRSAKWKVRRAYREGRYSGWYEVYLSEVNRTAYRRR